MRKIADYLKEFIRVLASVKIPMHAAQISFYLLLAFFPFCILMLLIIGSVRIDDAIFMDTITSFLPSQITPLFADIAQSAGENRNIFWSLTGIISTIWVSTKAMHSMIVGVKSFFKKEERWEWKQRFALAVFLTIALMAFIMLSILFILFGREAMGVILSYFGMNPNTVFIIWDNFKIAGTLIFMTVFFTTLYIISAKKKILIKESLPGAVFTSLSWLILASAFSFIITRFFMFSNIYGSIGSIILMMMWLYWGSHIILIGAAVNKTIMNIKEKKLSDNPQI